MDNCMLDILIPKHVWIENNDQVDSCDVIVEMENGLIYTAMFATLPYLQRQMDLSYSVCEQFPDTPPVRFAALETPHIIVPDLSRDTIEDTLDNLLALDTFGTVFTQVTAAESEKSTSIRHSPRATAEVAAVVLSQVLMIGDGIFDTTTNPTTTNTVA